MKDQKRIAIVGGGAVGLYLAWKLSERGHLVTVFERRKRIEAKACSALVSERIFGFVPGIENFIENRIDGCLIRFPAKTVTLTFLPSFICVPRQKVNELLAEYARSAGAEIVFGWSGNDVRQLAEEYDRVVGCDGALSKTRKSLGLPNPRFRLGIQMFAEERDSSGLVETWPLQGGGFCWRIPRGESVEYGILGDTRNAGSAFRAFLREHDIESENLALKAALVPQGLVLPRGTASVTLCGDAAGLTKPWSGGGLVWGFTAADILLKHFPDFEEYRREAVQVFAPRIRRGVLATQAVYLVGFHFPRFLPSKKTYDNDFLDIPGFGP